MNKLAIITLVLLFVGINVYSYKYAGSEPEGLSYVYSDEVTYLVDSGEGVLMASYAGASSVVFIPNWVAWIEGDSLVYKTREGVIIRSHIDRPTFEGWAVVEK